MLSGNSGRPGADYLYGMCCRRIPLGKILITVGAVVGLVFAQRRQ